MPFSAPSASILKPLCSLWCGFRWKWYRVRKTRYIKQDVANKTEQSGFALISNVAEKFCAAHPYAWSYFKRQAEKKPAIETVTFIQRHFQARDIKPYWSKAQHSKVAHSSTACRGPALGRTCGKYMEHIWGTCKAKVLVRRISTWALSSSPIFL